MQSKNKLDECFREGERSGERHKVPINRFKYNESFNIHKKREINMENSTLNGLIQYEKDFMSFQRKLPELRITEPDRFVAFKDGKVISTGLSVEEVSESLNSKGIEPSGVVIEFISKREIKVIV